MRLHSAFSLGHIRRQRRAVRAANLRQSRAGTVGHVGLLVALGKTRRELAGQGRAVM